VWWFFVYNALGDPIKAEGVYYFSDAFQLGRDLGGLPLILGLLADWVCAEFGSYMPFRIE
jgi:hypothetical protein